MRGRITPGRAAGVLALVAVLTVVTLPVLMAQGSPSHGVDLRQAGHWIYQQALKAAFHVHGGAKRIDARIALPGAGDGGPVVQGDTHAYLIDGSTVIAFGMSTLTVDATMPTGIAEEPVPLEVPGGPYLVYPRAGTVIRLGLPPVSIPVGGPVGSAVATEDGTVWVHRADTGALCYLARDAQQFRCVAYAPAGGAGALTTVDRYAGFFETAAGTLSILDINGLRTPVRVLDGLPGGGAVATDDSAGRLAVLDPHGSVLHLADTSWVDNPRPSAGAAVRVALEPGRYQRPVAAGSSVAVLDLTRSRLLTFGSDGIRRGTVPVSAPAERARLIPGADGRVYVDAGAHTLVVDGDGSVTGVVIGGTDLPTTVTPQPTRPPVPPRTPTLNRTGPTTLTGLSRAGGPTRTVPAAPGTPAPVSGQAGDQRVSVSWAAAPAHGAAITAYQVSWTGPGGAGGSRTVAGNALTTTVTGLVNGAAYRFTVTARNQVGPGPAATSAPVTPSADVPSPPVGVTAGAGGDGTVTVSWWGADGRGDRIARYEVAATGADGATAVVARPTGTSVRLSHADGLTLGVAYTFTVTAASHRNLASLPSPPSNTVVPYAPAEAPGNLTARTGDGAAELSWAAPALGGGDLIGYEVSGEGVPSRTVTDLSTRYTGLANGRQYRFSVRAVTRNRAAPGGGSLAGASASVSATTGVAPAVNLDTAALTGDRQVTVRVTVDEKASGPVTCQLLFNGSVRWRGGCRGTQDITVGGLDHGTDYDVFVRPGNVVGPGADSAHKRVRTNDAPTVTLSPGPRHSDDKCGNGHCAWLVVTARNFAPGTAYTFTCRSSRAAGGYHEFSRRTDAQGAASVTQGGCYQRHADREAWVSVGGVHSNHLRW